MQRTLVALVFLAAAHAFAPRWSRHHHGIAMTARNSDGTATATSSSRRESLATLAGASVLALSTPALAASKAAAPAAKPGAIGVSEADGFTAVLVSHGTRSFELYQDLINEEYFVLDQKSGKRTINAKVFDKYIGVIRNVIGRSVDAKGKETVHNLIVFRNKGLGPMADYLDQKKPLWGELKKQGLVQGPVHANFFTPAIFRGALPGPPQPLKRGAGVTYAQLPLKANVEAFADWEEAFLSPESARFHDAAGIFASAAGIMTPQTIEVSTDVKSYEDGVGVAHFTPSGEQASLLAAKLAPLAYVKREKDPDSPIGAGAVYLESFTVTDDLIFPSHPPFAKTKADKITVDVPSSVSSDKTDKAAPARELILG